MYLNTKKTLLISAGLSLLLLTGCGGGSDTKVKASDNQENQLDDQTSNDENKINESGNINHVLSYTASTGILIEKYGRKDLSWVNATGTACLKYKIVDDVSIYDKGVEYCNELDLSGIRTWRLPTEDEAVHFMANAPINPNSDQNSNPNSDPNYLIYPDNAQNCLFMASENSENFSYVYTTNHDRNGSFYEPNRKTAGIRCVSDN